MLRVVILTVVAALAITGCGGSSGAGGGSNSVDQTSVDNVTSESTTETESAADTATRTCADAFNSMSQQQKMEIAFKTYNLANAAGNRPAQWVSAIRVSVGGLADHSNQCLITIMYPPTPAEFQAARSIGREADFVADQFTYYSDGSSLERGANGPVQSLPDSVRTPNASLSLSGSGNNLDVQVAVN